MKKEKCKEHNKLQKIEPFKLCIDIPIEKTATPEAYLAYLKEELGIPTKKRRCFGHMDWQDTENCDTCNDVKECYEKSFGGLEDGNTRL